MRGFPYSLYWGAWQVTNIYRMGLSLCSTSIREFWCWGRFLGPLARERLYYGNTRKTAFGA